MLVDPWDALAPLAIVIHTVGPTYKEAMDFGTTRPIYLDGTAGQSLYRLVAPSFCQFLLERITS